MRTPALFPQDGIVEAQIINKQEAQELTMKLVVEDQIVETCAICFGKGKILAWDGEQICLCRKVHISS